jgi:hypothetical protein
MPDSYHVKVVSGANIVECEEDVLADELHDAVTRYTEDYLDNYSGYTLEITANH